MKRPSLVLWCAVLGSVATGCGPGPETDPNAGRGGNTLQEGTPFAITVSGRAEVFPEAARLLEARKQALPPLDGVPVKLEEPLRLGVSDAHAVLAEGEVAAGGGFSVPDVPTQELHLSLAASLEPADCVRSATIVYDTAFTRTRPTLDIVDARAWALPNVFHDALTRSIGEAFIRAHTQDRARTLRGAGFVLGRVVDAQGAPLAGARVLIDRGELGERVYYPTADFQGATRDATHASGLFLYVHSGADTETFALGVQGRRDYVLRNVSASTGQGLVVTLYPGSVAP